MSALTYRHDGAALSYPPQVISVVPPPPRVGGMNSTDDPSQYICLSPTQQRKPPQSEEVLARVRNFFTRSQENLDAEIKNLQLKYVFPQNGSVAGFLASHRSILQLLLDAEPQLRAAFGVDPAIGVQVPVDAFGDQILYAVVFWPGLVSDARAALECFNENWWLANFRRGSGFVSFTYELI